MTRYKWNKKLLVLSAALTMAFAHGAFAADSVYMNLDDAMHRAFATNPDISIAGYNLDSARASYNAAREARGVTIGFDHQTSRGGYNDYAWRSNGSSYVYNKAIGNNHSNGLSASLPIYTGGKLKGQVKQARANYEYNKIGVQRAYNEMRSTVATNYFNVLQTKNLKELGQESVTRLADHLKNVQAQYDVGVVAKVDVLRSQVELSDAEQSLVKAENNYDVAEANLNKTVGLPLHTKLQLDDLLKHNEYNRTLEECLAYAADHRPELEQAKTSVDAAKGALLVAKSGHMPQVSASAGQNWSSNNWPGDDNGNWSVGVGVSLNIFDSGVTLSNIHGAEADLKAAQETYRDTVDSVDLDVRTKYLSMREAEKRIGSTHLAVEQAEEDYRIAQLRYMNGVGTNTDVLDAQVALTTAQTNYLQALYDYNTGVTDVETAIGVPMVNPVTVTVEPVATTETK